MSSEALAPIDRLLAESEDADEALREAVRMLAESPVITWAGIAFIEDGGLSLGPSAGAPDESARTVTPILWEQRRIGELWVDGTPEPALLQGVADRLAGHVLVGWDTGGETWEP